MKTFSITDGRAKLGPLCRMALEGEDIGFVCNGQILALRKVEVISSDHALREYGLTQEEMNWAAKTIHEEIIQQRTRGQVRRYRPGRFTALNG